MRQWKVWWVSLYAIGLVLIPPIHFHDRLIFASEWLLIPLFFGALEIFIKRKLLKPPKELIFVWGACILAFIAGAFRQDLAVKISIYDLGIFKYFSLKDDGVVFFRTMIILSTPWLVKNVLREDQTRYLNIFIKVFKVSVLISALLAILDYHSMGVINLKDWGYFSSGYEFWSARARGTFFTPIEASFMYGITAVYLLTGPERLLKNYLNLSTLIFSLIAMTLTHSGTAMGGLLICICASFIFHRRYKKKEIIIGLAMIGLACVVALLVLPDQFFLMKAEDFLYRFKTYRNYLFVAPTSPWIFLTGIGFSRLCADNNYILLFIQGGILYFIAVLNWLRVLITQTPRPLRFVFLFWGITWLSFDTMGYWGIGRFCWFLLGFAF